MELQIELTFQMCRKSVKELLQILKAMIHGAYGMIIHHRVAFGINSLAMLRK